MARSVRLTDHCPGINRNDCMLLFSSTWREVESLQLRRLLCLSTIHAHHCSAHCPLLLLCTFFLYSAAAPPASTQQCRPRQSGPYSDVSARKKAANEGAGEWCIESCASPRRVCTSLHRPQSLLTKTTSRDGMWHKMTVWSVPVLYWRQNPRSILPSVGRASPGGEWAVKTYACTMSIRTYDGSPPLRGSSMCSRRS